MTGTAPPVVVRDPGELRARTAAARRRDEVVGIVPTMGALHAGHIELVRVARAHAGLVVVSDFVNPTQFGPGEDFERYPRDLDADVALCAEAGADVVFAPAVEALYPEGAATTVRVGGSLTSELCARQRPGHFDGVATVVAKLLCQVGPSLAVFGRKDYQQLKVVERLVLDLGLDVRVLGVPTVREPDGLAMSSRNAYLSREERRRALGLARGLAAAHRLVRSAGSPPTAGAVRAAARAPVDESFDSVDYVEVCDPDSLVLLADDDPVPARTLVVGAGRLGKTRLIDNTVLGEDSPPAVDQ